VFLDVDGEVCAVYFTWRNGSCWCSEVLEHIESGTANYRVVKIWKGAVANITSNFDYDVAPIWQEESEEQRERRKQIEQLEETIKKAQQQIEQMKLEK
jgi:hypothetical protein